MNKNLLFLLTVLMGLTSKINAQEKTDKGEELGSVTFTAKKIKWKHIQLGITKVDKVTGAVYFSQEKNQQVATWIPNEQSVKGYVNSLSVFISSKGISTGPFKVQVYECSPMKICPGEELINDTIIAHAEVGEEWVKIDLRKYRLTLPKNGLFIGVEPVSEAQYAYSDTIYLNKKLGDSIVKFPWVYEGFGPVMRTRGQVYQESRNKIWRKTPGEDWKSVTKRDESKFNKPDTLPDGRVWVTDPTNFYYAVPCIYADVSYLKEKNKSVFKDSKKRKLNRIQKTNENLLVYPQSSVRNLFESLIKAFENNDFIYVLRYLCVYKEDEFKSILGDIKGKEPEDMITAEEKKMVIEELSLILDNMTDQSLKPLENNEFKLEVKDRSYYLRLHEGKWKINPYTYRITG